MTHTTYVKMIENVSQIDIELMLDADNSSGLRMDQR